MVTDDEPIADLPQPDVRNNAGWQKRLVLTIVGSLCVACIVFAVAFFDAETAKHHGHVVFPPEMSTMFPVLSSDSAPVNDGLIEYYEKKYGLIDCVVGSKFEALCMDGTVDSDRGDSTCALQGGLKEWVYCR